jgi:hypothetical protein
VPSSREHQCHDGPYRERREEPGERPIQELARQVEAASGGSTSISAAQDGDAMMSFVVETVAGRRALCPTPPTMAMEADQEVPGAGLAKPIINSYRPSRQMEHILPLAAKYGVR